MLHVHIALRGDTNSCLTRADANGRLRVPPSTVMGSQRAVIRKGGGLAIKAVTSYGSIVMMFLGVVLKASGVLRVPQVSIAVHVLQATTPIVFPCRIPVQNVPLMGGI